MGGLTLIGLKVLAVIGRGKTWARAVVLANGQESHVRRESRNLNFGPGVVRQVRRLRGQ